MKKAGKFGDPKQIFAGDTGPGFFKTHKTGTVLRKNPEMIVSLSTENGLIMAELSPTVGESKWPWPLLEMS